MRTGHAELRPPISSIPYWELFGSPFSPRRDPIVRNRDSAERRTGFALAKKVLRQGEAPLTWDRDLEPPPLQWPLLGLLAASVGLGPITAVEVWRDYG